MDQYIIEDVNGYTGRLSVDCRLDNSGGECPSETETKFQLKYTAIAPGYHSLASMISTPINIEWFGENSQWERIEAVASDTVTIQVLDETGTLIEDDDLPGNAGGFPVGEINDTVSLAELSSVDFPVIRLKASLENSGISAWRVFATPNQ